MSQQLEYHLEKLELSGAGLCTLSELIRHGGERAGEDTISGIAYLLDIVGESILDHSNKARENIHRPPA